MIPVPVKWSTRGRLDEIILTPPGGPGIAELRYRERLPLRRPRDLAEEIWGARPTGAIERLVTHEGEHAALLVADGEGGVRRVLGMTLGDDICSLLDGTVRRPALHDRFVMLVRTLLRRDSLGLGVLRRRRYSFAPPAGWLVVGRNLTVELHPPGFPADLAMITVFPANPSSLRPRAVLDETLRQGRWRAGPPAAVETSAGLDGSRWSLEGGASAGELVVLSDDRFLYTVQLECAPAGLARHREVLAALVRSIEPVPEPEPPAAPAAEVGDQWAE